MKKFNVGLQLFGVRKSMANDFEGTLKAVADMGYEYVEFAGYYGRTGEEIKSILDKYGLKCVSVHQGIEFFDEKAEERIAFLKSFGVKYNVIPWYDREYLAGTPEWENTVEKFNKLAALLEKHGMVLAYHNHEFEFEMLNGKCLHNYLFDEVTDGAFVPEFDTCWVRYAGFDPAEKIREFSGRVQIVHLKDFVAEKLGAGPAYELIDTNGETKIPSRQAPGFFLRPLGQGMQDFAKIIEACEESGTETLIVEQDKTYDMPELEAARISREYLRNTFGI